MANYKTYWPMIQQHKIKPLELLKGLTLFIMLFCNVQTSSAQDVSAQERQALIDFYNATDGANWTNNTNWNTSALVSDWYGVTVTDGKVTGLGLQANNLVGNGIPLELFNLTNLENLFLIDNQLPGAIPSEIGSLVNLRFLNLSFCRFTGTLPVELANLNNLISLSIAGNNQLVGQIPSQLGNLDNLVRLFLYNNQLTGSIPPELGNLSNLESISLTGNQLTGAIPSGIGNLTNLTSLGLSNNDLSGAIPSTIGNLINLTNLNLENNVFTGQLPIELGNLINLEVFHMMNNPFGGQIPSQLGNLSSLTALLAYNNGFIGSIPPELGNLSSLENIQMYGNELTGTIPVELANLTQLKFLNFFTNQLSGNIPAQLGNLPNLEYLGLGNNQLSGTIPSELGNLNNLTHMLLENNQFVGGIPQELESLTNVRVLNVNQNQLSGNISMQLPPSLQYLNFSENNFVYNNFEGVHQGYLNGLTGYTFSPQAKVDQTEALSVTENGSITLTSSALTSLNNAYQWYKDGIAITGATSKDYVISNVTPIDAGVYHFLANNTVVTGLELERNAITLTIEADACGVSAAERQALVDLYLATDGPNWTDNTNWNTSAPVCDWFGVTVENSNVAKIILQNNNLIGNIPSSIDVLADLTHLELAFNSLSGNLQSNLGNLGNLQNLNLQYNQFTGIIPNSFENLSSLLSIFLSRNQLTGNIPAFFGNLDTLRSLWLDYNQLSGEILSSLGNLPLLFDLSLGGNQFTGTIPITFSDHPNLRYLDVSENTLSGDLPLFLGNLLNMTDLNLSFNQFTGEIPSGLGSLPRLRSLYLSSNQLTGSIPESIGNITTLQFLVLNDNAFSGVIPLSISASNVTIFEFKGNSFVFSDFESEHTTYLSNLITYAYFPQAKVDQTEAVTVPENGSITLTSTALTSSNNTYQWYKDGIAISGATGKDYVINNATQIDAGIYHFLANNTIVTGLELERNTITLTVEADACEVSTAERQALIDLYLATDGPNWTSNTNWNTSAPVCDWFGVTVVDGNITDLLLQNNALSGTITTSIGQLINLRGLDLSSNNLTGSIPTEIGQLAALEILHLGFNNLTGNIPVEIGAMAALRELNISYNVNFPSTIPTEIGNLTNLVTLNLDSCRLTGNLPITLGNLINLETIKLSANELSGTIPREIGGLLNLKTLSLYSNNFSGAIPIELGNLIALEELLLNRNSLTGTIPVEFGNLSSLRRLSLTSNPLTGTIPSELGNLSNLTNLLIQFTQVSGSIPAELGNLTNLTSLWLNTNQLTGDLPQELGNLVNLDYLSLVGNQLSGRIPPGLVNALPFATFNINNNKFVFSDFESEFVAYQNNSTSFLFAPQDKVDQTETVLVPENGSITLTSLALTSVNNTYQWYKDAILIPGATSKDYVISNATSADVGVYHFLANNTIVTGLELERNPITLTLGDDPCGVSTAERQALVDLFLATNGTNWTNNTNWNTSAPVCDWFGVTVTNGQVTELSLQANNLSGNLPIGLGDLTNLSILYLHFNNLTGSIPIDIGSLSNLNLLYLDRNQLTGSIPAELGNLSNLTFLNLHTNQLTGTIPPELGGLASVRNLWLFQNQLSGTIPPELGDLQSLLNLNIGGNLLTGEIPMELGNLSSITSLNLAGNQLTTIPTELGNLSTLITLTLTNNLITNIPSELGNLVGLKDLRASDNLITNLPPELGNLNSIENIDLQRNQITGIIPDTFGNLSTLRSLALQTNQLTGEIPSSLGNLSELYSLGLTDNQLSGSIPSAIMGLTNLTTLWLSQNQLTGNVPSELSNLSNLRNLGINDNQLTGVLPTITSPDISSIHIRNNNFIFADIEGSFVNYQNASSQFTYIPQAKIDSEETIDLVTGNSYTMSISLTSPNNSYQWYKNGVAIVGATQKDYIISNVTTNDVGDYYCRATNSVVTNLTLERFPIHITVDGSDCPISQSDRDALIALYNNTNGTEWTNNTNWLTDAPICEWYGVGTFGTDISLNLGNNNLVGTIPPELGDLTSFKILFLGGNQLSGSIPSELGSISGLTFLTLNDNQLSGAIPDLTNTSTVLLVNNNNFVFSDIEEEFVNNTTNIPNFIYAPQAKVDEVDTRTILEYTNVILSSNDLTSENNDYQWYFKIDENAVGVPIPGATSKDFIINGFRASNAGIYYFEATNSIVEDLILTRNEITLNVDYAQHFCTYNGEPTIADLEPVSTDGLPLWYTTATGGTFLDPGTPLINAEIYWQDTTNTLTERIPVRAYIDIVNVFGDPERFFDFTTNPTLNDITFTVLGNGSNTPIAFYATTTSTEMLPYDTPLIHGQTYYVGMIGLLCRLEFTVFDSNLIADCIDVLSQLVDGSFETATAPSNEDRNGSLEGSGWITGEGSPDTFIPPMTNTTDAYLNYNFTNSPNGGICAGALRAGNTTESFYFDVTGLTIGEIYVVEFYQANTTNLVLPQLETEAIGFWQVDFGNQNVNSQSIQPTSMIPLWERARLEFTIANETERLQFSVQSSPTNPDNAYPVYMLVDGIRVYKKQNPLSTACYDIDTQSFCDSNIEPTIADLVSPLNGTTTWYNLPVDGTPYSSTEELAGLGSNFVWADNASGNPRVPVEIIFNLGAPVGDEYQEFEALNSPTLEDIQVTGDTITWYDSETGTTTLPITTPLVTASIYYAAEGSNACRLGVEVFVGVLNPIGDGYQEFCSSDNPTIADLEMELTNASYAIVWYSEETGGVAYGNLEPLVDGVTYYAEQTDGVNTSEERIPVVVSIIEVEANIQIYNRDIAVEQGETIALLTSFFQLDAATLWYDAVSAGNTYSNAYELIDGATYYTRIGEGLCSGLEVLAVTIHIQEIVEPELITCIKFIPQPGDRYVINGWVREDALITTSSEIRDFSDVSDVFIDLLDYLEAKVREQESIPDVYVLRLDPSAPNVDALVPYVKDIGSNNLTIYNFQLEKENTDGLNRTIGFSFSLDANLTYKFTYKTPLVRWNLPFFTDRIKEYHYPLLNNPSINITYTDVSVCGDNFCITSDFSIGGDQAHLSATLTNELSEDSTVSGIEPSVEFFTYQDDPDYQVMDYVNTSIELVYKDIDGEIITLEPNQAIFQPKGNIIDGWQRISTDFTIPTNAANMTIFLKNKADGLNAYFDDVRMHPFNSNLKSFVYDAITQRLQAELDENNYTTFYEYDSEGGLVRVKKETERGVYTIQETRSGNSKLNN